MRGAFFRGLRNQDCWRAWCNHRCMSVAAGFEKTTTHLLATVAFAWSLVGWCEHLASHEVLVTDSASLGSRGLSREIRDGARRADSERQ